MQVTDTHCHLNLIQSEEDLENIIENAINNNIYRIMVPGIDLESSKRAISIAEKFDIVYASVGIHPNDANTWKQDSFSTLKDLAQHPKVRAIGEIGLDFFRDYVPPLTQIHVFKEQIKLAEYVGLPIIVHSRNAINEVIVQLLEWKNNSIFFSQEQPLGVLHAFEGNLSQAHKITSQNFFIGIGGPITYKNSQVKQDIVKNIDINSIVLETDSPFLAPHPFRGSPNQPAYSKYIAEKIANLMEKPLKWILQETTKNANKIFAWEQ